MTFEEGVITGMLLFRKRLGNVTFTENGTFTPSGMGLKIDGWNEVTVDYDDSALRNRIRQLEDLLDELRDLLSKYEDCCADMKDVIENYQDPNNPLPIPTDSEKVPVWADTVVGVATSEPDPLDPDDKPDPGESAKRHIFKETVTGTQVITYRITCSSWYGTANAWKQIFPGFDVTVEVSQTDINTYEETKTTTTHHVQWLQNWDRSWGDYPDDPAAWIKGHGALLTNYYKSDGSYDQRFKLNYYTDPDGNDRLSVDTTWVDGGGWPHSESIQVY